MRTLTKELQAQLTPAMAIELLKKGNRRFVNNLHINRDLLQQVNETSQGQYPFAIVLSCIDSRTSAELIFDQGLGDIFSVRIAGNIVNEDILGSMEFACKLAGSKLIVVLGHTNCGAIKGACDNIKMGHLTGLVQKIRPSIESVPYEGERKGANEEFVQLVAEKNVNTMLQLIQEESSIIRDLLQKEEIGLIGSMYHIETGVVTFFDDSQRPLDAEDV